MAGQIFKRFARRADDDAAKKAALAALRQDAPRDITTQACLPRNLRCAAKIIAKAPFILCGIVEAGAIFSSRNVDVAWKFPEGQAVKKGQVICSLSGKTSDMLASERTALNYLSLLSGVASKCRKASKRYGRWKISATRKTLPGLSDSEKRAVLLGGCLTHRMSLADGILVKDNHISAICSGKKVARGRAVEIACGCFGHGRFVEVEVSSKEEALAAALCGADALLVDNVTPLVLRKIAGVARKASPKIIIEASGGITLSNAGKYLAAGADFVSTSELTMRIEHADLSLEIE